MRLSRQLRLVACAIAACAIGLPLRGAEKLCSNVAELRAAFKVAQPGDNVLMRDGTWTDAEIVFEGTGEAGRPITLRAQTPGQVVVTGRSRLRFSGRWLVVDGLRFERCNSPAIADTVEFRTSSSRLAGFATNSRLTNCTFIDCSPPDKNTNTRYVSLFGYDNRVDHCYLSGKTNLGPSLVVWLSGEPVRHQIDHNHFARRPPLGFNGGETIRIGDSTTSQQNARCAVTENLFTECNGEVEIISNKSCENVYRHNTFIDCEGTLTLRHGHRNVVDANFFFGHGKPKTGGIRIINVDQRVMNNYLADLAGEGPYAAICLMNGIPNSPLAGYDQVTRAVVAFNTIVNCRESIVVGYQSSSRNEASLAPRACVFDYNAIVGGAAPLVRVMTRPERTEWRGNFFRGEPGVGDELHAQPVDPGLTAAADGRWRPARRSAMIGAAGDAHPEITEDCDGQPRPAAAKDAGCDQVSDAPIRFHPLTPRDVGPAWRSAMRW